MQARTERVLGVWSATIAIPLLALLALPASAQVGLDRPLQQPVPHVRDSGAIANSTGIAKTVHTERVEMGGAAWLRLYFGDVVLGRDSFIRITSELDGEVQELDAQALSMWSNTSAYFNGDALTVELVGGAHTSINRLVIDELAWEAGPAIPTGSCGICGGDSRLPSDEDWAARLLPAGCSASVWNNDSCMVTAGHCLSSGMVVQFRVPDSASNCALISPPVAEQFPVIQFDGIDGGPGNDWGVMVTGTNNLGQQPYERYGLLRPLATTPPSTGQALNVWGYGVDDQCTRNQIQQDSNGGSVSAVFSTSFSHTVDATFGNSGSGIIRDGEILGIVTHCPCPNTATRVDHPSFRAAQENLCSTLAGSLELDRSTYTCADTMLLAVDDGSLEGDGTTTVEASSDTESSPETIVLHEVSAGDFEGMLVLDPGPPSSGDGMLSVSDGDTITVLYIDRDNGAGGQNVDVEVTAGTDCTGPAVTQVEVSNIAQTSADIDWDTDELSDSLVRYGTSLPLTETLGVSTLVLFHHIALDELSECTDYFFSVSSTDPVGNETVDDNSGSFHSFSTSCSLAPPPVPDGSGVTQPLTAAVLSPVGPRIGIEWDNTCSVGPQKLIYGPLDQVSSYAISGAICGIDPSEDSLLWSGVPTGNSWFLMVGENDLAQEGSWGLATSGERNGAVDSGQCDVVSKNPGGSCQ